MLFQWGPFRERLRCVFLGSRGNASIADCWDFALASDGRVKRTF